jgi:hypothetical protein
MPIFDAVAAALAWLGHVAGPGPVRWRDGAVFDFAPCLLGPVVPRVNSTV